ncbi:hypothetical protein FJY70_04380 [candidate division WOR-3 bacterium]|nr:hypothetical protein [candidate division WOR-3 bacterium]
MTMLNIYASHAGVPGEAAVELVAPNSTRTSISSTYQSGGVTFYQLSIDSPSVGTWQLVISAVGVTRDFEYRIDSSPASQALLLTCASANGASLQYPAPLVIRARVQVALAIAGANVNAEIVAPDGSQTSLALKDDGLGVDLLAGDGEYSGTYTYRQDGTYIVTVQAAGDGLGTVKTYKGLCIARPAPGSPLAPPADQAFWQPFTRAAQFQVAVAGTPQFINVTPYTSTDFATWQLDRNTGAMMGSMIVSNHPTSTKTLLEPFWYVLQESQNVRLYQIDGYTNGMPYTEITAKVNTALQAKYGRQTMQPSEWVTIDGMRIWSRDRSIPELSALWALYADPPGGITRQLDAYDFNKDGLIGDSEVLKAVNDWHYNDMEDFDLLRRIEAWKTSGHGVGAE